MLTKRGRLVFLDSARVSGLHSCQAVGLSMCARTYGLLDSLQRLVRETGPGGEEAMAWVVVQRHKSMGGAEGGALVLVLVLGGGVEDLIVLA
jgi:hypothetical protein